MSRPALYKLLPSVDRVLQSDVLSPHLERFGLNLVKQAARQRLDALRYDIAAEVSESVEWIESSGFFSEFCQSIGEQLEGENAQSLLPVVNLTGTVIHTNLGRSRLPGQAVDAMVMAATHATNLEFDLETGRRGDRDTHLDSLLGELTGAEAATIVNNNAAAVLLLLNTLARSKEVIISRGELVEIGGAFRIPDVMQSAGCTLKEIGTTNRTHLRDYEAGITDDTALLMKVHTSNYEIRGFTNSVSEEELASLAHRRNLPFASDLGSGTLVDLKQFGLPHEPTVKDVLSAGADIVTFSGDKLLGGPQAGIIVGSRELIDRIKSNPLKRALRVDKITLAGILEVLTLYTDPDRLLRRLPLLSDLTRPVAEIEALAGAVLPLIRDSLGSGVRVEARACKSQIGSGALPLETLPSFALVLTPVAEKGRSDEALLGLAAAFRRLPRPVIGRVHDGSLFFDLRCLRNVDDLAEQLSLLSL